MVIPPAYAQINLHYISTQLPYGAEVTLGLDTSAFVGDVVALTNAVDTAYASSGIPALHDNDIAMKLIHTKEGPNNTGAAYDKAVNYPGSAGSGGVSPATCYLVHKHTALGGHAGSGRLYMPGVIKSAMDDDGVIHSGTVTSVSAAWNTFKASLAAANLPPVLLHGASSPISIPTPIAAFACDGKAATQRRRMRR